MSFLGPVASADDLEREAARAADTAAHIEADWPLLGTGPVPDFVRTLGARLGEHAGEAPFPWRFVVFRDRGANAFAIGGGRIYVSDGTIRTCRCEAELAAIVAHEMGHELAGHLRTQGHETEGRRSGRGRSTGHVRIGSVTQELDPEMEVEADRISVRILRAAGYAPRSALDIAERLSQQDTTRSEPFGRARLSALALLVQTTPSDGRSDSPDFQKLRDHLADADSP